MGRIYVFHHTDMDGMASGAIARLALGPDVILKRITHNIKFPFDIIDADDTVYIVDFCIEKDGGMERLLEITENVFWIDHHGTAIKDNEHLADRLKGLRRDGTAACALCWEFFFGTTRPLPRLIRLLSDYDTGCNEFGDLARVIHDGCSSFDTNPASTFWEIVFNNPEESAELEDKMIEELKVVGSHIKGFMRYSFYRRLINDYAFMADFEGHRACVVNAGQIGSHIAKHIGNDFELLISFVYDGEFFTISLYSFSDDIDVAAIASKFGGGGHPKAAGFQIKELPFKRS